MTFSKPALVLLLLATLSRLNAQDDDWKPTAQAGYASARVFRGVERSGATAQASAELAGDGFRGSVWTSQPFKGGEPGETDLSAGYTFKMPADFALEATVTQFVYSNTASGGTRQSTEAGLEATWTSRGGLTASLGVFHDFRLLADTVQATAGYSLALKSLGAYLELNSFGGWENAANLRPDSAGSRVRDGYGFYGAEAQLPYRMGPHTTLVAGVHCSDTIGQSRSWSPTGARGGVRTWISFAVSFDF